MGRIELTAEKFAELFGGKPVVDEGDDPEFMRILQRFIFGEVFYTGDLDDQTRELITVSVLTANQTLPQLTVHVRAALAARPSTSAHPSSASPRRSTPSPR